MDLWIILMDMQCEHYDEVCKHIKWYKYMS